jgi:hypothetical protein
MPNTSTPPSQRSQTDIDRSIESLKSMAPEGTVLYSINHGTHYQPKLSVYVVVAGEIVRVTATVAQVIGVRWNNETGYLTLGKPGYKPCDALADKVTNALGYQVKGKAL